MFDNFTSRYNILEVVINNFSIDSDYYIKEIFDKNPREEYISFYPQINTGICSFLEKCLMCGYYMYVFDKYHVDFSIECKAGILVKVEYGLYLGIEMSVVSENKIHIFAQYSDNRRHRYNPYNNYSNLEVHLKEFLPIGILDMCNLRPIPMTGLNCNIHNNECCIIHEPIEKTFKPPPYGDLPLYISVPFISEYARMMLERGPVELPQYKERNWLAI